MKVLENEFSHILIFYNAVSEQKRKKKKTVRVYAHLRSMYKLHLESKENPIRNSVTFSKRNNNSLSA